MIKLKSGLIEKLHASVDEENAVFDSSDDKWLGISDDDDL